MSDNNLPLVSVLVPLYNHEAYIRQCLDSILADTYPHKQLVVLDDGSQDGSAAVAREWVDENSTNFSGGVIFISRENRGTSRTLNELFSHAEGDFIAPVSSDDYLLADSIRRRVEYLQAHPEKMVVICDYTVVDTHGGVRFGSGIEEYFRGDKRCLVRDELLAYELIFRWSIAGPVYLFRKDFLSHVGGYDDKLIVEDWDMCLRLAARDLLGFIDYTGAAYRIHGDNVVSRPGMSRKMLENQIITAIRHLDKFPGLKKSLLYAFINQAQLDFNNMEGRGSSLMQRLKRIFYKIPRWRYRRLIAATFGSSPR